MATTLAASLGIKHLVTLTPDPTAEPGGKNPISLDNTQEDRWRNGAGSGLANRVYKRIRTIGSGATDSYNILAAGSLVDILNQAIDLDELSGITLRCTSGSINFVASAGTPIGLFLAAGDGLPMVAGDVFAYSWGAAGLDVTTNSLFEITETTGTGSSAYVLEFHGAN